MGTEHLNEDNRCTDPADETLGVPEGVECGDVVLQDGSGTAAALGGEHVEVVLPAIRLAIFLMKTCPEDQRSRVVMGMIVAVKEVYNLMGSYCVKLLFSSENNMFY